TGIIDALFALPKAGGSAPAPLAEGIYLVDGTVYQVARSKTSGKAYAKVLDPEAGKFLYAPGAIFKLPADAQPVTVDDALNFGLAHGICVKGHPLTDPL